MASNDGSGNAWLRKGIDPSSVDENFKDGYIDMLAERRKPFNDLSWVLKKVQTPDYKYKHKREYAQLNKDVLYSDRVSNVVEEVSCKVIDCLIGLHWKHDLRQGYAEAVLGLSG